MKGKIKLSDEQLRIIIKMTGKHTRREIAEKAGVNPVTVWRYQKKLELI